MEAKKTIKVALVQCPMFNVRMPQLGPAYLKSNLEKNGHVVNQFDFNIALYNSVSQDNKRYWDYKFEAKWTRNNIDCKWGDMQTIEDLPFLSEQILGNWAEEILRSGADLIGFTVYYTSVNVSILLAKKIKELDKNKKIIFGGPFITAFLDISQDRIVNIGIPLHNIFNIIDMIAVSEGEETILEVVERLKKENTMRGCQSVIAKEGDFLIVNDLRPLNKHLDLLPFPDFSILDAYTFIDKNFLPILSTRGCPNKCTFCDSPYLDRYKLRFRGIKNVIEEIKFQIKRYGIEFFHFNDLIINANLSFLSMLCDLIIEEEISIRWGASASINDRMDKSLFDKLKQAGCEYLSFGIESASEKVLRDMKKNFSTEAIKRNMADCYNAGISVCTNWIIGFFSEDDKDFEKTLNFIEENIKYISEVDVALFSIKPHTYVYNNCEKLGLHLDNNFMWNTLDFKNNYETRLRRLEKFKEFQKEFAFKVNERIGGLRED